MAKKSVCEFNFERDRTTQQLCRMSGIVTNRFHDFTAKNGKFFKNNWSGENYPSIDLFSWIPYIVDS